MSTPTPMFLDFIAERLVLVHNENPNVDYILRLKQIADNLRTVADENKMYRGIYRAMKCPCGHQSCENWMIYPDAMHQGVSFTKVQARAIANLLNGI